MGYWDNQEEQAKRGIDYDLSAALYYNEEADLIDKIHHVYAVWQGENDGDSWRWIFVLSGGQYVFMAGWCDYTGWDCQSGITITYGGTIKDVVKAMVDEEGITSPVAIELIKQLTTSKDVTWSESFDIEKPEDF
jgi:hypothetical protein